MLPWPFADPSKMALWVNESNVNLSNWSFLDGKWSNQSLFSPTLFRDFESFEGWQYSGFFIPLLWDLFFFASFIWRPLCRLVLGQLSICHTNFAAFPRRWSWPGGTATWWIICGYIPTSVPGNYWVACRCFDGTSCIVGLQRKIVPTPEPNRKASQRSPRLFCKDVREPGKPCFWNWPCLHAR